MKWKVIRKTYHNGLFIHPGEVIEESDKFDGRPNMEPVKDEPKPVKPEIKVDPKAESEKGE